MRKIDEQKKQLIEQTVFVITKEEGIQGLSFGKIAKRAQVSSGAPYVYFKDKTDMLSQLYLKVKLLADDHLQQDIDKGKTIEENLFLSVNHFARVYANYPLEANFMTEIRANPKLVTAEVRAAGNRSAKPLVEVMQAAIAQDCVTTTNVEYATVLLFAPFMMLLSERAAVGQTASLDELEAVVHLAVEGILKK